MLVTRLDATPASDWRAEARPGTLAVLGVWAARCTCGAHRPHIHIRREWLRVQSHAYDQACEATNTSRRRAVLQQKKGHGLTSLLPPLFSVSVACFAYVMPHGTRLQCVWQSKDMDAPAFCHPCLGCRVAESRLGPVPRRGISARPDTHTHMQKPIHTCKDLTHSQLIL